MESCAEWVPVYYVCQMPITKLLYSIVLLGDFIESVITIMASPQEEAEEKEQRQYTTQFFYVFNAYFLGQ